MRTIELNKVGRPRHTDDARFRDTDDVGENGGADAVIPAEGSALVGINVDAIRCYYPRTQDRPGTRITFIDGGGFAVVESYEDVKAAIAAASA